MKAVRLALVSVIALLGCPESISTSEQDATVMDAGTSDTGADSGVVDSGPPRDGGAPDTGLADAGDGGIVDTGVTPPAFTFATMQLPANQVSATTVWGRASSEVYAGTINGNVLRYTPPPGNGWEVAWHEPSNFGISRIRGTSSKIFVAAGSTLWVHDSELGVNPRGFGAGNEIRDLHVVSDDEAYVVADKTNGRAIYEFDGVGVTQMNDQLNAAVLHGVYVDDADATKTVLVTANGKIFRYQPFMWIEDAIDWPADFDVADIANFDLYDAVRVGERLFVVGDDTHILEWDEANAIWRFAFEPRLGAPLRGIAAVSGTEAYAVGRRVTGGPIVRFAEGVFTHTGHGPNHNLWDVWATGPNELFCAGTVGSTLEPVILRGFRP